MPSKLVDILRGAYSSLICETPQVLQSAYLSDIYSKGLKGRTIRVSISAQERNFSLFSEKLRPVLGTTQPRIQWVAVVLYAFKDETVDV
jgi:hypothetical protein